MIKSLEHDLLATSHGKPTPNLLLKLFLRPVLTNGVVRHGMPVWSKLPEPQRRQIVSYLKSSLPLESLHSDRGEYSQLVKYCKALTTPESSGHLVSRRLFGKLEQHLLRILCANCVPDFGGIHRFGKLSI
jgi:hypothetical protein